MTRSRRASQDWTPRTSPSNPCLQPKARGTYAQSGELEDANLTLTMPPPSTIEFGGMTNGVFYLRPHSLGGGSSHHPSHSGSRSRDASPSKAVLASDSIEYPFRFPPLEGRDGVRLAQQQGQWQHQQQQQQTQQVVEEGSEQAEEKQQSHPDDEYYQQYHRRARSSGMVNQPQMLHPNDMYDGRAFTAQPSSRSHQHVDSAFSAAHAAAASSLSLSLGPSHSQAFLDFFGPAHHPTQPRGASTARGAASTHSQQSHAQGRRGKGLSTGRSATKSSFPPGSALPPLSLSSMTSRSHRFHHDYPSAFTHAQSTAVAHASVAGPRNSPTTRRSQRDKLEQLLEETILAGERQMQDEQQQKQQMAVTKLQPRPPTTQKTSSPGKQEELKEQEFEQPKTA